jgi:hypothetical protein
MRDSGKLVILGIVTLATMAASASWMYRYVSTNRAARFWGSTVARCIRDAPLVELHYCAGEKAPADVLSKVGDISYAPGLTHLRHALLENRSFVWPAGTVANEPRWYWALAFHKETETGFFLVLFTEDCRFAALGHGTPRQVISCEPIANGLRTVFAEIRDRNKPQG